MDRYEPRLMRPSTVEPSLLDDCWTFKNRKQYSKARVADPSERTSGYKKIINEV